VDASKELRASSDNLLDDLALLAGLEQQKRDLQPGSPELVAVAQEIEQLARRVLGHSQRQRSLTEQVNEIAERATVSDAPPTIEETPREIHVILADWRDAERRAQEAGPGSSDAAAAASDIDRFREEYRAAHEYARRRRG
jgi:hypothetical protein